MKHPHNKVSLKTDRQRLLEWRNRVCPYCDSDDVMVGIVNNGKYRALCFTCRVENYFSGKMVEEK